MKNLLTRIRNRFDDKEARSKIHSLTRTEKEVLKLLALCLSAKEIAEMLNSSTLTIQTHLHHIYKKVGVHSATQAVRFYIFSQYGLIDLECEMSFLNYV